MAVHILGQDHSYLKEVTLHDTTDNLVGASFIQNVGTSGLVMIRQSGGYGNVDIWLNQGESASVGQAWSGAMSTGTDVGVDLRAWY